MRVATGGTAWRRWGAGLLAWAWRLVAGAVFVLGTLVLTAVVLQFTPVPERALSWLANPPTTERYGAAGSEWEGDAPGAVLLLAGSGIPGETGLVRAWHAAELARRFPEARVYLALPEAAEGAREAYLRELDVRGVERWRVTVLGEGNDTYHQAEAAAKAFSVGLERGAGVVVVTSPEHEYRVVACLRRQGVTRRLWACPAYSKSLDDPQGTEPEMRISPATLEPSVAEAEAVAEDAGEAVREGRNQGADRVRRNLDASQRVLDELLALAAYRFRGWL